MRLTLTLIVTAIGSLLFGLAYLFFPETILSLYGISIGASSQWVARCLGAVVLGFAVIDWLSRNEKSGQALAAVIIGNLVVSTVCLIISILQSLTSSGNWALWITEIMFFLLVLGFGDFVFRTPPPK